MDVMEGHSKKQEQPMQRPRGGPFPFPGTSSSLLSLKNGCLCILLEEQKGLRPYSSLVSWHSLYSPGFLKGQVSLRG